KKANAMRRFENVLRVLRLETQACPWRALQPQVQRALHFYAPEKWAGRRFKGIRSAGLRRAAARERSTTVCAPAWRTYCQAGRLIGMSEPTPCGVLMVVQVPLATSFQALP